MNKSTTLIKFDIKSDTNEYYNYQILAEDGIIIENSGKVGSEHLYQAYNGDSTMFDKLVKNKIYEGYKELQVESVKEGYAQLKYQYSTEKISGLILFESDIVEKFIQKITNNNLIHNIIITYSIDYYPITNINKTPLGLILNTVIIEAIDILERMIVLLNEYLNFGQSKQNLKFYLLGNQVTNNSDEVLDSEISENLNNKKDIAKQLCDLINGYFSLIPTSSQSEKIVDMLLDNGTFFYLVHKEICNLMLSYYDEIETLKNITMLNISDNDIKIEEVSDGKTYNRISNLYLLNNVHINTRIKNIFSVKNGEYNKRFEMKSSIVGNIQCVWHGTNKTNLASILTRGLLLPGKVSVKGNGGHYGPGIYFSSAASMSLKFCKDWINTSSMSVTTTFLILASVAAGSCYFPVVKCKYPPNGYDSIWANKYSGSCIDELIVYSEDQARIDYIIEIEKK